MRAGSLIISGACAALGSAGIAQAAHASAPPSVVAIEITLVNGDGGSVADGATVHPTGPGGELTCQADGTLSWRCTAADTGSYSIGATPVFPTGVDPGAMLADVMCTDAQGAALDPYAMALTATDSVEPAATCVVSLTSPSTRLFSDPGPVMVASEAPVPSRLPATGGSDTSTAFLAVGAIALGAGLRTLAKRPVR